MNTFIFRQTIYLYIAIKQKECSVDLKSVNNRV